MWIQMDTKDSHKQPRPLLRPSVKVKRIVDKIQKNLGLKSQEKTLDLLLGNVNPDDFTSQEVDVIIKPKKKEEDENGKSKDCQNQRKIL